MKKTTWTVIGGAAALALSPVAAFGVASLTDHGVGGEPVGESVVVRAAALAAGPGEATSDPVADLTGTQTVSAPTPVSPLTAQTPRTASSPATPATVDTPNTPPTPASPVSPRSPLSPRSPVTP